MSDPKPKISADGALAFGRVVYYGQGKYGQGKIEILPKIVVKSVHDIAVAVTPGVGHAVRAIAE